MTDFNIKKGWLLVIDSWENDADYMSKEYISLGSEQKSELYWLLAIIPRFQKGTWEKGPGGESNYYVGNIYEGSEGDDELLREILTEAFKEHWSENEYYKEFPDDFEPQELLCEYGSVFLGTQDGQWTRKIDSVKLYEVPEDINLKEIAVAS